MDVNYGKKIREYLLTKVSLLRLHRFAPDSVQFDDALVSSAIICFKKTRPVADQTLDFTYGGTLLKPQVSQRINLHALTSANKWNKVFLEKCSANQIVAQDNAVASVKTLSEIHSNVAVYRNKTLYLKDFFEVKRGLATGANDYFILTEEQISHYHIPGEFTIPVLPSPRYVKENIILADKNGYPQIKNRQFLFTSDLPENVIRNSYPAVWEYLQLGLERGINQGYLCKNRKRWYQQEKRPDCQFLFAYMGRVDAEKESPFRFLLNYSNATVTNAYYILYPKPFLKKSLSSNPDLFCLLFDALQEIPVNTLVGEGRIYGGGLHKMEPKELANVPFSGFYFQYLENMKYEREEFVNLSLWDEEVV
jgi:hypothetical protein